MNKYHQEILKEIQKEVKKFRKLPRPNYLGTSHYNYGLTNPQKHLIAKEWVKKHKDISLKDFLEF